MNPDLDTEHYEKLDEDQFEETLTKLADIIQTLEKCGSDCKRAPDPEEAQTRKES